MAPTKYEPTTIIELRSLKPSSQSKWQLMGIPRGVVAQREEPGMYSFLLQQENHFLHMYARNANTNLAEICLRAASESNAPITVRGSYIHNHEGIDALHVDDMTLDRYVCGMQSPITQP